MSLTPYEPKIIRHGKSMFDILDLKKDFFTNNGELLRETTRIANIYKQQPVRKQCKLCGTTLPRQKYFTSHDIDYYICSECHHLNGHYEDTRDFANAIYSNEQYAETYNSPTLAQYDARLNSIYVPKASFLITSLQTLGIDCDKFEFLDVGSGSGYMVGALQKFDVSVTGIEVSVPQVKYGNSMLGGNYLHACDQDEILKQIFITKAQVLSFIGVFEHISDLTIALKNIRANKNVQFVFFSVPMFSLTCVFEAVFHEVFNRHLGGGHTHLFSRESLEWMYHNYGFIPQAIWNFGTDVIDLYRSLAIMLEKQQQTPTSPHDMIKSDKGIIGRLSQFFKEYGDGIQYLLDISGFTSEVHILVQVNHDQ
jgi:2-polyprenyl-3-methyl-5-hydroxy-6-metoxy-1,4-benzoquinol methylase